MLEGCLSCARGITGPDPASNLEMENFKRNRIRTNPIGNPTSKPRGPVAPATAPGLAAVPRGLAAGVPAAGLGPGARPALAVRTVHRLIDI